MPGKMPGDDNKRLIRHLFIIQGALHLIMKTGIETNNFNHTVEVQ